jgi:cytochrome c
MRIASLWPAASWAFGAWLLLVFAPQGANAAEVNPCATNPCAHKSANPCASNPCAGKPANPCAANPCAANPCAATGVDPARVRQPAGVKLRSGDPEELRAEGKRLWNDPELSGSGLACASCHTAVGNSITQMQATFAEPYPHRVAMAADAGLAEVNAAEMVQLCMMVPMGAQPLPWDGKELAALVAYVSSLQEGFEPSAVPAHPCAAGMHPCNPCGSRGANPCDNPCAPR